MICCTSGWRTTSASVKWQKRDAADAREQLARLEQARALPARQVDLRDVAGDHRLGVEAEAGEEHLHLLARWCSAPRRG